MTTTSTCQGYDQSKPTSRVLQPPGGGSSNIFGFGGGDEPAPAKQQQSYQRSNILGQEDKTPPPAQKPAEPQPDQNTSNRLFGQEGKPQAATPVKPEDEETEEERKKREEEEGKASNNNSSTKLDAIRPAQQFNPITGEAYVAQPAAAANNNQVPSTRVRQPPGGASSGLW